MNAKTDHAGDAAYHAGVRQWQDRFDSRRLADRLAELSRTALSADDRAFVERQPLFFFATADADGQPDVSYKGGDPGFVHVLDDGQTLAFPSYDGNGMFRSLGNLEVNPRVGMLFIDFEQPQRLRVMGRATASVDDALITHWAGADAVVRVAVELVFPNCPRYIHRMQRLETSPYVPREGCAAPEPAWKRFDVFSDVLPRRTPR